MPGHSPRFDPRKLRDSMKSNLSTVTFFIVTWLGKVKRMMVRLNPLREVFKKSVKCIYFGKTSFLRFFLKHFTKNTRSDCYQNLQIFLDLLMQGKNDRNRIRKWIRPYNIRNLGHYNTSKLHYTPRSGSDPKKKPGSESDPHKNNGFASGSGQK